MERGMSIARINFSHGDAEQHRTTIRTVKSTREKLGLDVALMLDTKGPEIRTGDVKEPILVKAGQEVLFTPAEKATFKGPIIHVNYPEFSDDAEEAEAILVDNGELSFTIVRREGKGIILKAGQDGAIGNRRHVNLPGAKVSLPSMTDKDWKDLELGIEEEMDIIALSFIRTAEEVKEVKAFLKKKKSTMKVMAKIETRESVKNINAIIAASDSIMVARGDLGAEIAFQKIPAIQDAIVETCRIVGKPVIVATQMLESMIENPMPTRAEVTDVAHAAVTRADCTMLSGETAAGKFPFAAVEAMTSTLVETETNLTSLQLPSSGSKDERVVRAEAAITMANASGSPAIVVLCNTGRSAEILSMLRPQMPIFAFSDSHALRRTLQMYRGVYPLPLTMEKGTDENTENALGVLQKQKLVKKGQNLVFLCRTQTKRGPIINVHLRKA